MTKFEHELLNLLREAMRQRDEPTQRRIIDLEKSLHERVDKISQQFKELANSQIEIVNMLPKNSKLG